ncbi:hypothetical protein JNUCC1_02834 [Lentibacillus sp. JNUCC-1]|uniref:CoxG family protein n=1 Tax=Lentibacillus sp. JNUCC-1 TaxID=2654513 RepID=UPI0012E7D12A|nr:SRPBCC family protein [Lentibacillus sp. JNUCC-1]MUV38962.1 hypothetical protein [Lentibacillus sp. JNUCC-1]
MPSGTHAEVLNVPVDDVWNFVSDIDKWAPLMPGYVEHEILNDKESKWAFFGDIGIARKKIKLKVHIKTWQEPSLIEFDLTGLNEKFTGEGSFLAETADKDKTRMTGYLDIKAKGMRAPVINSVLKSFVPKQTRKLTESMAEKIKPRSQARN